MLLLIIIVYCPFELKYLKLLIIANKKYLLLAITDGSINYCYTISIHQQTNRLYILINNIFFLN